MEKIYIIKKYTYSTQITDIIAKYFTSKENAKNYVIRELSQIDRDRTEKAYKRGLLTEFEFIAKNNNYQIIELEKWG